jgi:hypothetical protein
MRENYSLMTDLHRKVDDGIKSDVVGGVANKTE